MDDQKRTWEMIQRCWGNGDDQIWTEVIVDGIRAEEVFRTYMWADTSIPLWTIEHEDAEGNRFVIKCITLKEG